MQRLGLLASLLGEKEARSALVRNPLTLLASQETIQHSYSKFEELLGKDGVLAVLNKYPGLLGSSWRSMGPKWQYVFDEMGVDKSQFLAFPNMMTYSLKNRIRPRLECMRSLGRLDYFSIGSILRPTDEEFARRLGNASEEVARLYCSAHFVRLSWACQAL